MYVRPEINLQCVEQSLLVSNLMSGFILHVRMLHSSLRKQHKEERTLDTKDCALAAGTICVSQMGSG